MRSSQVIDPPSAVDAFTRKLLTLYPAGFRERYSEELISTIHDMQRDGYPHRNDSAQVVFMLMDLLKGLVQENIDEWRTKMNKKATPWVILGTTILAFWLFMFSPSLTRLFFNWQMKDAYLLLLGENPARFFVTALDVVGYLGPLLAFVLLLVPVVTIDLQKLDGLTMQLRARKVGVVYSGFIIAVTLLSLGWIGLLVASRF
jgi:hypothetical protein